MIEIAQSTLPEQKAIKLESIVERIWEIYKYVKINFELNIR